jgi:hypothetical protein
LQCLYFLHEEKTLSVKLVFHPINKTEDIDMFIKELNIWYSAAMSDTSISFEQSNKDEHMLDNIEKENINGMSKRKSGGTIKPKS